MRKLLKGCVWTLIAAFAALTANATVPTAYTNIVEAGVVDSHDGFAMLVEPNVQLPDPFTLDITYKFEAFTPTVKRVIDAVSPLMQKDDFGCADFKDMEALQQAVQTVVANETVTQADVVEADAFLKESSPYWERNCDFVISFDKPVKAGTFVLGGRYEQASKFAKNFNGWVCSSHTNDLAAGERMRLLKDNNYKGVYVTYYEICARVQEFLCGVKNLSAENIGTTMTVELRIYDSTETYENSELVGSYAYTFEGAADVDGTAYLTLEEAVAAWKDGSTLTLLKDGQANLTVPAGEARKLDLNGCVLSGSAPVTVETGAGLTVLDSDPTVEHSFAVAENTGLWTLDKNGAKTLAGGCITGGLREVGGGILNGGVLVLKGGNVVGNRARSSGGGIANTETATSFAMVGGSVTGNVAEYAGGVSFLPVDGTFTMTGGDIASNVATGEFLEEYDVSTVAPGITPSVVTNSCGGGGVFNAGTFRMSGGSIRDNRAVGSGGGVCNGKTGRFYLSGGKDPNVDPCTLIDGCMTDCNGGGIANYAVLSISGGIISNCDAKNLGGGVYTRTFGMDNGMDMTDGVIKDCSAHGEAGDGVASEGGTVEISGNAEITLSFSGFNTGVGVFANGGMLAVRGGRIQISPKTGPGSVGPGELEHLSVAAILIIGATATIEGGEVKSEYGDAIWAEMYDSKFTLTGDAQVHGNITLKVVTTDEIEISGGKLDGVISATDDEGNEQKGYITDLDSESQDQDPEKYAEKHPVTETSVAAVVPAGGTSSNGYDTVQAAFNELTEGSRLVLLKADVDEIDATVRFAATTELNGHAFSGCIRCSRQFNIVSGPNGGGEKVTLSQYTANNSDTTTADVLWGTDGKPLTIDASGVSVTHGRLVLADMTDVTVNSTPGGYAGIAKFVLCRSLAEGGSVTNSAKLTLRGGRYGSDKAWLENPSDGSLEEVDLADYVADGYVLRDNLDWTFSVIPRPVKVETPNLDVDEGVISSETDEGAAAASDEILKDVAEAAIKDVATNEAAANFKDTNVESAIQDDNGTTAKTVLLLQSAAETQVTEGNVTAAKTEIASSKDVKSYINVKLTNTTMRTYTVASESTTKTVCNAVIYDVKPIVTVTVKDGEEEKEVTAVIPNEQLKEMGATITFRLPVPSSFEKTVKVYHEGELYGIYPVQTECMSDSTPYRFVELESDVFSSWKVETSDFVACIGKTGYKTLQAAFDDVKANETIELLGDFDTSLVATNRTTATLDLAGFTVTATNGAPIVRNESNLTVVGNGNLFVTGSGELYAIHTVSDGGAPASITISSGVVDGVLTDGENVAIDLAGARFNRACKCLVGGEIAGKITNGSFQSNVTLPTDAARATASSVAKTHYVSYSVKEGYRDVVKNKIRANWTDSESVAQERYYATFQDAITACYGINGLTFTLCENVSESLTMPTDREGAFTVEKDGYTFSTSNLKAADGYDFFATPTGYEYHLRDAVAEVVSADGKTTNACASVKRAFAEAAKGTDMTVRLLVDTTTDTVGVSNGKSVTLDLNGKTLSGKNVSGLDELPNVRAIIVNAGNLTIVDSSGTDAGCLYNGATSRVGDGYINPAVYNYLTGTLTVESGTIGKASANYGEAIYNDGTARIRGGKFTNYSEMKSPVFYNNKNATMDVTGGTVTGQTVGWFLNAGTLTVGGEFAATAAVSRYGVSAGDVSSTTVVTNGTFKLVPAVGDFVPSVFVVATNTVRSADVRVSGGEFEEADSYAAGFEWRLYNDEGYGKPVLTGGTYPTNVNVATAPFYYSHDNKNGTWTVLPWKDEYDAITNVFPAGSVAVTINKDGKITVKLLESIGAIALTDAIPEFDLDLNRHSIVDLSLGGGQAAIVVTHDESVLDGASKTITIVGPGYVKGGDGDADAIQIGEGAKLAIDSTGVGVVVLKGIADYAFTAVPFAITDIWVDDSDVFITFRPDFSGYEAINGIGIAKWAFMGADGAKGKPDGIKALTYATLGGEPTTNAMRFVSATADEVTVAVPRTENATAEFYKIRMTNYP